jgi:hypothetical protein
MKGVNPVNRSSAKSESLGLTRVASPDPRLLLP